jgi:hypothetical protein
MKYLFFCLVICANTGCTMMSLERHTVGQADSAIDLRYREIMENLAQVAVDRSTLPNFTTVFSGTVSVQDTGQLVLAPTWPVAGHVYGGSASGVITPSFNRQISQNWTLDPIIVPEQLEAMRAALQWAIGGPQNVYPDSWSLLISPEQAQPGPYRHFGVVDKLASMPVGWLCAGQKADVPACAHYKAHCGDHWVWVTPDGMRGLADLTLVIQDIARVPINAPTLFNFPPSYSSITLKTADPQAADSRMRVTAQLTVDQSGRLYTDPFIPIRIVNAGGDSALRSIITAASITTTPIH